MNKSSRFTLPRLVGVQLWLVVACGSLMVLNGIALSLYFAPPGGTRTELRAEQSSLRNELAMVHSRTVRLKTLASAVQSGRGGSADFETRYFLPRRQAYVAVIEEIQRMAAASGIQERDAVFGEDPVDGTQDLSVLSSTANYEGTYNNVLRFLQEVDRSPMLLILDNLQAAPQQTGGSINTSIRFQTIMREDGNLSVGGQP